MIRWGWMIGLMGLGLPSPLLAQDSVLLRHAPVMDAVLRIAFQSVTTMRGSDGRERLVADLGVMHGIVMRGPGQSRVWHLTYDSVRTRTREPGGRWQEFTVPGSDSAWVQVRLDERMRVLGIESGGQSPGVTDLAGVLTGMRKLELPATGITVGERWSGQTEALVSGGLSGAAESSQVPPLTGQAEFVLDSIVARSHDTLGYVSVTGQFEPRATVRVEGTETRRVTLSGALTGSLVWSTAWSTFVSGVNWTQVHIVREDRTGGVLRGRDRVTVESTTRYQVRP